MKNKQQVIKTLFLGLFVSVSLVACGGGGGKKANAENDSDGDGIINTEDAFPNDDSTIMATL